MLKSDGAIEACEHKRRVINERKKKKSMFANFFLFLFFLKVENTSIYAIQC